MDYINTVYRWCGKSHRTLVLKQPKQQHYPIIGMLRVRNESLILQDTLAHLSTFCDAIIAYDDDSTDSTKAILCGHDKVIAVICNLKWKPLVQDRLKAETNSRQMLYELAQSYAPEWYFYSDADERFIGNIKEFLMSESATSIDAIRISLFDAYMTIADQEPYQNGPLLNFRQYFGIERRDIIMAWRPAAAATFQGLDQREPCIAPTKHIATQFYCQHYGKSLSAAHWEETCEYYINHFPYETYGKKWEARKGKAVHNVSDFNTPLYAWGTTLFEKAEKIHP